MAESRVIYIAENEDILEKLDKENIKIPDVNWRDLAFISNKKNNNQVGYFQFRVEEIYYKFFIIPKIHKDSTEKEKDFISYFTRFYELKNKYRDLVKYESVEGNIVDVSFENFDQKQSGTVEEFIQYKYEFALKTLDKFFRKHSKTRIQKKSFSSQSIQHKLDLSRNIREIDKSKVHQIRREEELFSEIAEISRQVLKSFKTQKIKQLSSDEENLIHLTNGVLNQIQKRYKAESGIITQDRQIITNRIRKLFKGKKELSEVYLSLLILVGLEHYQSEDSSREVLKLENMIALFFNPADLYEWIVFDWWKTHYPEAKIQMDGSNSETKKNYQLILKSGEPVSPSLESRPDLIVETEDQVWIIDAKWKTPKTLTEITFADISKLQRDFEIRKGDYLEKAIENLLIFPKTDFTDIDGLSLSYSKHFEFGIREIRP
jgi:hypothetical protein